MLLYFALGSAAVIEFIGRLFLFDFSRSKPALADPDAETQSGQLQTVSGWAFTGSLLLLALIGSVLPLCEMIIPQRFAPKTQAQLEVEWIQSSEGPALDLSKYSGEQVVFLEGRAFYPRFYKAGEGDSGGSSSAKRDLDMDRLVWMFHDQGVHVLCCPLTEEQVKNISAEPLPDPMDVLVAGIQRDDYIEVLDMKQPDPGA